MKTIRIIILLVFLIGVGNTFAFKNKEYLSFDIKEVKIKDAKIDSVINVIIENNQKYLKKGCYLLFAIEKSKELIFNIAIYEKEKFKFNCCKNEYPILGYTELNNQTILIVGEKRLDIMKFSGNKKTFVFKLRKKSYPPSMYNPPVYRFLYNNNRIIESK
jgi:hypothetical protein